jgi:hypothetical protein
VYTMWDRVEWDTELWAYFRRLAAGLGRGLRQGLLRPLVLMQGNKPPLEAQAGGSPRARGEAAGGGVPTVGGRKDV